MAGTVLYRKWRPQRFADIVGQDAIVRTLKNAVIQDRLAHAYLFCGPRGTGKTSTGRILAKAVNSPRTEGGDPLLDSEESRAIETGSALDLIEIDAASNRGIDNIRDLRERANYSPGAGRFKVYLIDEVHQLTDAAADALLKTLEEPPPHVIFILATTDPEALKPTILSRCQRFDFRRVGVPEISGRLCQIAEAEEIQIPDEALTLIAREATGSLRDAINLLDQIWAAHGDEITLEDTVSVLGLSVDARALDLARAALTKDLRSGLTIIAAVQDSALDLQRFNRQVVQHLRHGLLAQTGATDGLALSDPEQEALRAFVKDVEPAVTVAALHAFGSADFRADPYSGLPLELALGQLVYAPEPEPAVAHSPPASRSRAAAPRGNAPRGNAGGARWIGDQRGSDRRGGERRIAPARGAPEPRPAAPNASSAVSTGVATDDPAKSARPVRRRELTAEEQMLQEIQNSLDEHNEKRLAAFLRGGSCRLSLDGDTVTLTFGSTFVNFHMSKVEESRSQVEAAAKEALGRAVSVVCVAEAEASPTAATTKKSALVAEAEKLGARVVGRQPQG